MSRIMCFVLMLVFIQSFARANEPSADEVAIRKTVESYVEAFNRQDAKGLAAHWSEEGVYSSRLSGEQITGRAALETEFAAQFQGNGDVRLEVRVDSIEFVSPNVALEHGTATVTRPDETPDKSSYTAVHVKRDGKWLLDRVREEDELDAEEEEAKPISHYEQLKDLEWMIGKWVDDAGGDIITTECEWTRNKNHITRSFTVTIDGRVDLAGMQIIGWDPALKQIRSWIFDSDGGFVEGVWSSDGDRWLVQSTATLPDGTRGSYTSVLRPLDENSFGWQKTNRVTDGKLLPSIDEVVIIRADN